MPGPATSISQMHDGEGVSSVFNRYCVVIYIYIYIYMYIFLGMFVYVISQHRSVEGRKRRLAPLFSSYYSVRLFRLVRFSFLRITRVGTEQTKFCRPESDIESEQQSKSGFRP